MPSHNDKLVIKEFVPRSQSDSAPCLKRRRISVADADRKRIKTACENCRVEKVKCTGGVPCQRCNIKSTPCRPQNDRGRARPLSSTERVAMQENILKRMLRVWTLSDDELVALSEGSRKSRSRERPSDGRPDHSSRSDSLFGDASLPSFTQNLQDCIGETGELRTQRNVDQLCRTSSPEPGLFDTCTSRLMKQLPTRSVGEYLIRIFHRYVQCNGFYVHEQWTTDTLELCYGKHDPQSVPDVPRLAALSMLMALGTQFDDLHQRSAKTHQKVQDAHTKHSGDVFYEAVFSTMPHLIEVNIFESVRCVMLLAVYMFPHDLAGRGYSLLGLALHMALSQGMHLVSLHQQALLLRTTTSKRR